MKTTTEALPVSRLAAFKVGYSNTMCTTFAVYAYRENAQVKMFDASNEAHANSVADILNKSLEALRGSTSA